MVDAQEEGHDPEARRVRPERHEADADVREDERRVPEDEIEIPAALQPQPLRPRKDRVEPDGERDPLGRCPEEPGQDRGGGGERRGRSEVDREARRAPSSSRKRHEREGRDHRSHLAQEEPEGMRARGDGRCAEAAARRLAKRAHPECEEEARKTHDEERGLPAVEAEGCDSRWKSRVPAIHDEAADSEPQARADENAAREDAENGATSLAWEPVREEGVGGGRRTRLARADAEARERERSESAREARERGHQAPERRAPRDEAPPVPGVREAAERDREDREEDGEDGAIKESQLGVGDLQVRLDALGQDHDDLAVDEVEDVHEDEDGEHVPRIDAAGPGLFGPDVGHGGAILGDGQSARSSQDYSVAPGPTIFEGSIHASNCSDVTWPDFSAASLSVRPS